MHAPAGRITTLRAAIILFAAAFAAYHGMFGSPFVFDDEFSIVKNTGIRSLRPLAALLHTPGNGNPVQGRPVLNVSFALNYAMAGLNPGWFRFVNLMIHVANGLLLFLIVRASLQRPFIREQFRRSASGLAFSVALLWTVHPLATSAVTYVTQRSESLAALWYLLCLWFVIRSAGAAGAPRRIFWEFSAVTACGLGMGTKETMASAPLMVLVYDTLFLSSGPGDTIRKRWPLHAGLMCTWIILIVLAVKAQSRGGTAGFGTDMAPFSYAATQVWAIVHYLRLSFWPSPLVFDYGIGLEPLGRIIPSAVVFGLFFLALAYGLFVNPRLSFAGLFMIAVLAPSSSFIPVSTQTIAEHRMYLPLAGVVLFCVMAFHAAVWARFARAGRAVSAAVLCIAALALCWTTAARNRDYENGLSLWLDTVKKRPQNARALAYAGAACLNDTTGFSSDNVSRALTLLCEAVRVDTGYGYAYVNRGLAFARQGRFDDALRDYDRAAALGVSQAELFNNRGILLGEAGHILRAIPDFREAVRINPLFRDAWANLGLAYVNLAGQRLACGDSVLAAAHLAQALENYGTAIRCDSSSAPAYRGRAMAYSVMGLYAEAAFDCSRVIRIDPADATAYGDRAICYLQTGRYAEARQDADMCRKLGGLPGIELVRRLNEIAGMSRHQKPGR